MVPDKILTPTAFIDVVAKMNDQVHFFLSHVLISGIEAMFVLLAGSKGKAKLLVVDRSGRGSLGSPHRASGVADLPAVVVFSIRRQSPNVSMSAMAEFRHCRDSSKTYDVAKIW